MYCPACKNIEMDEVSKQGVLIDVCPRCRGVWLDRGELEKILSAGRTVKDYDELYGEKQSPGEIRPREAYRDHDHYYDHDYHKYKKRKKKRSFFDMFEEIFD